VEGYVEHYNNIRLNSAVGSGHELPPPLRELLAAPVPHSPAHSTSP